MVDESSESLLLRPNLLCGKRKGSHGSSVLDLAKSLVQIRSIFYSNALLNSVDMTTTPSALLRGSVDVVSLRIPTKQEVAIRLQLFNLVVIPPSPWLQPIPNPTKLHSMMLSEPRQNLLLLFESILLWSPTPNQRRLQLIPRTSTIHFLGLKMTVF